jgi:hypothetical protein
MDCQNLHTESLTNQPYKTTHRPPEPTYENLDKTYIQSYTGELTPSKATA